MVECMVSINHQLRKPYSAYGLQCLIDKFGIPAKLNQVALADVQIGYSGNITQPCHACVEILSAVDSDIEPGYLVIGGIRFPVFVIPQEVPVSPGEIVLATYYHRQESHPCVVVTKNKLLLGFDIFEQIGRILASCYDHLFLSSDRIAQELKSMPVVDAMEELLLSGLKMLLPAMSNFNPTPIWPDGHQFALVLTHDVDRIYKTYQYLPSIVNSIRRADISELGYHLKNLFFKHGKSNPYWTFENLCSLEDSLGVKSTYYFLNERGKLNPLSPQSWILYKGVYNIESKPVKQIIQELAHRGFEIGVHGSYNSFNNLELLETEKCVLELIAGSEVAGFRQHYLNYDIGITPDIHCKTGFQYDASIGFRPHNGIGFRRGTSFPFRVMLSDQSVSKLLEIPLIIMDGATDSASTADECFKIIEQVEKYGGVLTILWHTHRFNPREYPGMVDLYVRIIKAAQDSNAWVATANEVCDWLIQRQKTSCQTECA